MLSGKDFLTSFPPPASSAHTGLPRDALLAVVVFMDEGSCEEL